MNYFSPETCRQLQQLGCVASSGKYHYINNGESVAFVDAVFMGDYDMIKTIMEQQ